MNWQVLGYTLYLMMTALITFGVGLHLYRQGIWYLREAFPDQESMARSFNQMLLAGYYLLNLGYACISLVFWTEISGFLELVQQLVTRTGFIMVLLGGIHYGNLWVFRQFSAQLRQLFQQFNH